MGPWVSETDKTQNYVVRLDGLYQDPENGDILIVLILDYVKSEIAGMSETDLKYTLEDLRRLSKRQS